MIEKEFKIKLLIFSAVRVQNTNMVIKITLYHINRIPNSFYINNDEKTTKKIMRTTSAPPMNQISQHGLSRRKTNKSVTSHFQMSVQ